MKRSAAWVGMLTLVTTLACDGEAPLVTAAELWCQGLCTAQLRCGYPHSQEQCRNECIVMRPGLVRMIPRAAALEGDCIASFSCVTLYDKDAWATATNDCWNQAVTKIELTHHVRSFCAAMSQVYFECGYSASTETCELSYRMYTDSVIDGVADCLSSPTCEELDACVALVFKVSR